jgi:hypothetical protein
MEAHGGRGGAYIKANKLSYDTDQFVTETVFLRGALD